MKNTENSYPLSYSQKSIWFNCQLSDFKDDYNLAGKLLLNFEININNIIEICQEIIDNHEQLRAVFYLEDNEPFQKILKNGKIDFKVHDISHFSESELSKRIEKKISLPFNLELGPLIRFDLFSFSKKKHVFLFCIHHIICDGWSLNLLIKEFFKLFFIKNKKVVNTTGSEYEEFVSYENEILTGSKGRKLYNFWDKELGREITPVLFNREKGLKSRIRKRVISLPEDIFKFKSYTTFVIITALFKAFLYKYSGQKTIFTAIPMLNRIGRRFRRTIGNFVNIVLLKADFDDSLNFNDLLEMINQKTREAFHNQEYPLSLFAEKQRIQGNPEYPFITNGFVSIAKINIPEPDIRKIRKKITAVPLKQVNIPVDMGIQLYEIDNRKIFELYYKKEVFSEKHIERIIKNIKILAEEIIKNPGRKISDISIISGSEAALLKKWNIQKSVNKKTVITRFEEQVKKTPQQTAITFKDQRLSYRELNTKVNRFARYLKKAGLKKGKKAGVLLDRSDDLVISMLAVIKTGGVFVPLNSELPDERLKYMITKSEISVVISEKRIPDGIIRIIRPEYKDYLNYKPDNLNQRINTSDPAYIIFTSGSTGNPKGVIVDHKGIGNLFDAQKEYFNMKNDDKILQFSSSGFDAFIWEVIMALLSGASLILCGNETVNSVDKLSDFIKEQKITIATLPPAVLSRLSPDENSLRIVISAGEECFSETAEKWISSGKDFFNAYGPTEATVCVSISKIEDNRKLKKLPIGRPIRNMYAYILDEKLNLLPVGAVGELYVSGVGIARGYINENEKNKKYFLKNPFNKANLIYRTGDLACWTEAGELEFHGRVDRQIKLRGFRIEPGEIEQTIIHNNSVRECVVCFKEEGPGEGIIIAFIVSDSVDLKKLKKNLKTVLPDYMIPARFVFIKSVPLTENKKADYKKLLEIFDEEIERKDIVNPVNPCERILLEIWKSVLDIEKISTDDNFFSLGGHSLRMTQVLSRIRDRFKLEIPLKEMFDLNTIVKQAEYIESKKNKIKTLVPELGPGKVKDRIQLSYSQERIWFIHKLEPESIAYNIILSIKFRGNMNIPALKIAYEKVIERHEILRTTFYQEDGVPLQKVNMKIPDSFIFVDLDESLENEEEADRFANEEVKYLFNLETGPLIRMSVIKYSSNYIIILNMHHIISDLWSTGNFAYELSRIYYSNLLGKDAELPELSIQYSDYSQWQRRYLTDDNLAPEIEYWKSKLKGLPVLKLPQDKTRPLIQTYIGSYVIIDLNDRLLDRLKALSLKRKTSLFMVLLAGFYILLYRHTGMVDIPVGTPVANRLYSNLEHQIGTFVNTIVLRASLKGNPKISDFIESVKNISLEAFSQQNVPFEKLVGIMNPDRDLSHLPLVQVLFNVANAPVSASFLDNVDWEIYKLKEIGVQFDLTLTIEHELTKQASFHYNTDLFERSTIKDLANHYLNILYEITEHPDKHLSEISILTENEKSKILIDWNRTENTYPKDKTFGELFENTAGKYKARTAVTFNNESVSFMELNERSNRLAGYLRKKGTKQENIIAVYMDRSPELLISLLAVMKSGAAYLPLDLSYPAERLEYMLNNAKVKFLLTQSDYKNRFDYPDKKIICIDSITEDLNMQDPGNLTAAAGPENSVYVIYTSGSTGNPKGVQITHRNLINFLYSMKEKPGLNKDDRLLAVTPVSFDISCLELYLPLITGAEIILADADTSRDGLLLNKLVKNAEPTVIQATPSTWQMLMESGWPENRSINKILCGGETLSRALSKKLFVCCESLWNLYGPTETTVWSSVYCIESIDSPVLIGKPIANTSMYILDPFMNPVPAGVSGELYIGGDGVAKGYLYNNELTEKKFVKNIFNKNEESTMYRTGDLVKFRHDGNIEFIGRRDFQIKLRGHRIELGEIDFWIQKYKYIKKSITVIKSKKSGENRIISYIINDTGFEKKELFDFLHKKLPDFMIPADIVILDFFPLTPNNKLDIKSLPEPVWNTDEIIVTPENGLEEQVLNIWKDVLKMETLGMNSNFFEHGGHSLLAVRLLFKIKEIFNVEIPLRFMFTAPTPGEIVKLLKKNSVQVIANRENFDEEIIFIMQKGKNRRPLFLITGVYIDEDGIYRHLSNIVPYLGLDQPAYGLRPRGLISPGKLYKSITLMARDYVKQIKKVQPRGPYILAGECIGGVVALEAAALLAEQDEEIDLVMLLDTFYPAVLRSYKFKIYFIVHFIKKIINKLRSLFKNPVYLFPQKIRNFLLKQKNKVSPKTDKQVVSTRFKRVEKNFYRISTLYNPKIYKGRISLVVNEIDHNLIPYLGWKKYFSKKNSSGRFETYVVPGNHITRLTTYRKETGAKIRQLIDSCIK